MSIVKQLMGRPRILRIPTLAQMTGERPDPPSEHFRLGNLPRPADKTRVRGAGFLMAEQ